MTPLLASRAPLIPAVASLRRRAMGLAAQTAGQIDELLAVSTLFQREGLRWMSFKGPLLAVEAYGDAMSRPLDDLDLILHPEDAHAACRLLAARGYRVQSRSGGETRERLRGNWGLELRRENPASLLDVKLDILPRFFGMSLRKLIPWNRPRGLLLDGQTLPALPVELNLLALCAHGAWHRWERLLWACDVAAILRHHPGIVPRASVIAAANGWTGLLALGVKSAERLLGVQLAEPAPEVPACIQPWLEQAVEDVRARAMTPRPAPPERAGRVMFHLRTRERLRDRLLYRFRLLTGSSDGDWKWLRLPGGLAFAYPLLRPFRLALKLAECLRPR